MSTSVFTLGMSFLPSVKAVVYTYVYVNIYILFQGAITPASIAAEELCPNRHVFQTQPVAAAIAQQPFAASVS
jgi:hypothetical protein